MDTLPYTSLVVQTSEATAIARFLRSLSASALELARQLDGNVEPLGELPKDRPSIERLGLGSLQFPVARVLATADLQGLSPREVAKQLGRADEPNVRTALIRLEDRGVAERVPEAVFQRWRLTPRYRPNPDGCVPTSSD